MKPFKGKTWAGLFLAAAATLAISGCKNGFDNQVSPTIPQNASGIYTFRFSIDIDSANLIEESVQAKLVINGSTYPMEVSSTDPWSFRYEYKMPAGLMEAKYFYIVEYEYENSGKIKRVVRDSFNETKDLYYANIANLYTIQLLSSRGPVGSRIALSGTGFAQGDTIMVGDTPAQTIVNTPRDLEFVVPPVEPGKVYPVTLETPSATLEAGTFIVDAAQMQVLPDKLNIFTGEIVLVVVELGGEAPPGGMPVEVATDIPDSLIVPEIVVPAGATSVNVNIEGAAPGSGSLQFSAGGFNQVIIPVKVN